MSVNRRTLMLSAAGALVSGALPVFAEGAQVIGGPAFGSWWRASLPQSADAAELRAEIEAVIEAVDAAMSPFRASSEINRLNASADKRWIPVSGRTASVIAESLRTARLTDGAFDPTVGPLVSRFGFGPIKGAAGVGYQAIILGDNALLKRVPEVTLDLCGIAKGYALDRMAGAVAARGIRSFVLEAGGEVLARGHHPSGRLWQVGIESPNTGIPAFQRIVKLDGLALATSGVAMNGGTGAGLSYNHIINPQTERPVANGVASVSVIAGSAMRADALATALVVMGAERGLALAEQEGIAAFFQIREGLGIIEKMSRRFARHIVV